MLAAVGAVSLGFVLYLIIVGFHTRLCRDAVAGHPLRRRILEWLARRPGVRCADVAAELGVHHTTAVHHLRALARWGLVRARRTSTGTLFSLVAMPAQESEALALLRRPDLVELVHAGMRRGSFHAADLARDLRIPQSTAAYRAKSLTQAGMFRRVGTLLTLGPQAVLLSSRFDAPQPAAGTFRHGGTGAEPAVTDSLGIPST